MPRNRVRALIGLIGLALTVASTAAPAQASDDGDLPVRGPATLDADSTYLAGYTTTTGGVVTARTKTFTVPSYPCEAEMTGVTIGILDLQAEGFPYALADVYLACVEGAPMIVTEAYVAETVDQGTAEPGDKLRFSLSTKSGKITATVTNLTNPAGSATVTATGVLVKNVHFGAGPLIGPEGTLPVPDLGTITLVGNRTSVGSLEKSGTIKLHRVNDGVTEIKTGKLRGGSFTLTAR